HSPAGLSRDHVPPADPEVREESPQQRQAQPDDGARVALDRLDEGGPEPVEGEAARDVQRLVGGEVAFDLLVVDVTEVRRRTGRAARGPAGTGVEEPVAGVEDAAASPQLLPPPAAGHLDGAGLAVGPAVDLE